MRILYYIIIIYNEKTLGGRQKHVRVCMQSAITGAGGGVPQVWQHWTAQLCMRKPVFSYSV